MDKVDGGKENRTVDKGNSTLEKVKASGNILVANQKLNDLKENVVADTIAL